MEGVTDWRTQVPGADVLANVAAKDMRADSAPVLLRNWAAQFDSKVGDAAARVHRVLRSGGNQSFGRARVDATGAGSAAIGRRRIDLQFERCDQLAQKEPRPERFVDQTGILPDPAKPREAGEGSFQ